ncbi:MAG: Small ribosomal subunit biosis GTPase RsgA [Candidatus Saccharibacteria bacterium]|nr:Small ribosomal subunit biosis GTPase RsgA [Candidatus Saccharibacteria bacterium]
MHRLTPFGWNDTLGFAWEALARSDCIPARVIADFGSVLQIATPEERQAELSGKLLFTSEATERPKVGDWVAVALSGAETATIEAVLPRTSEISRKHAGERAERQILATNVDVALIVQSLDNDFSVKRIERYLFQLQDNNIQAVLVLNKADQVDDMSVFTDQLKDLHIPTIICSASTGQGMDDIVALIKPGQTAVLLGSSGVGKSTITNYLFGKVVQDTGAVREADSTGRHTTTHRELFRLKGGGLLIDTPGIRELQLWGTEEELEETFEDVAELMTECRYSNCGHTTEDGCAIRQALADGRLSQAHYDNYLKMSRELQLTAEKAKRITLAQKQQQRSKLRKLRRRSAEPTIDD